MAIIYRTTLTPTKLELLTAWLPSRPWYEGQVPDLVKAGGFRLDDPAGEVGIEFMIAVDSSHGPAGAGDTTTAYHVPLTYRGQPLDGADDALIGTTEHGVLGQRWVYDGTRDPVLVAAVVALLRGEAEPQAQSTNDIPDPTVLVQPVTGRGAPTAEFSVSDGPGATDVRVGGALSVRVHRVLAPAGDDTAAPGSVSATWRIVDDARVRGILLTAQAI